MPQDDGGAHSDGTPSADAVPAMRLGLPYRRAACHYPARLAPAPDRPAGRAGVAWNLDGM